MIEEKTTEYAFILETSKRGRPSRRKDEFIGMSSLTKGVHLLFDGTFLEITPKEFFPGCDYPKDNVRDRYRRGVMMRIINGVIDVDESGFSYPKQLREGIFMEIADDVPLVRKIGKKTWLTLV